MLKMDCKHIDEYIPDSTGTIYSDWCLLHDCFNCDTCGSYEPVKTI